jgi:Zn-dependent metalloprotease
MPFVKTANLAYQKESGAMNEAFLIFGAHVSNITQHRKSTWLIGEDMKDEQVV